MSGTVCIEHVFNTYVNVIAPGGIGLIILCGLNIKENSSGREDGLSLCVAELCADLIGAVDEIGHLLLGRKMSTHLQHHSESDGGVSRCFCVLSQIGDERSKRVIQSALIFTTVEFRMCTLLTPSKMFCAGSCHDFLQRTPNSKIGNENTMLQL